VRAKKQLEQFHVSMKHEIALASSKAAVIQLTRTEMPEENSHFVFFHVGPGLAPPTVLTRSLRRYHEKAHIVQCSDRTTPRIEGVDDVARFDGAHSKPMMFRTETFAGLQTGEPTFFLDTDMICVGRIDPAAILGAADVAVCVREFQLDAHFKEKLGLTQYAGKTIGQVYPYIGCATITRSSEFWSDCLAHVERLDEKFQSWYGDQEAIREVARSGKYRVEHLPESIYACLPDMPEANNSSVKIFHFKGPTRKKIMADMARKLGLI
jgi:hypothetical protein